MIKKYCINQNIVMNTKSISVHSGAYTRDKFGEHPLYKQEAKLVPNYEQTNILFAEKIASYIKYHAKELGEITKIELEPSVNGYKLIIRSVTTNIEEEIDVPEHYGEEVEDE